MREGVENTIASEVYPNPAANNININIPAAFDGVITIADMNGKIVKSMTMNSTYGEIVTMDISNLASGIYSVTTATDATVTATKLVKE